VQWSHTLLPCPENSKEVCVAGPETTSVEALIDMTLACPKGKNVQSEEAQEQANSSRLALSK